MAYYLQALKKENARLKEDLEAAKLVNPTFQIFKFLHELAH